MTANVAVVGSPFLDLTFEGLPRIPAPGEELLARALHVAPGGTGMQAIGLARLGLRVSLVAPVGRDAAGELLRAVLDSEGVRIVEGSRPGRVPTTALLSTPDGVAMATALGEGEPTADDVLEVGGDAVVVSLGRSHLAPAGSSTRYVVTGGLEVPHAGGEMLSRLDGARAFVANQAEAVQLTGAPTPEDAARALTGRGMTAVVTLGADGAIATEGDEVVRTGAPRVDVVDATGGGDLFVSAYVWADLRGAPLGHRLAWATLYATLSIREPTAFTGAVHLDELLSEGRARGLIPP